MLIGFNTPKFNEVIDGEVTLSDGITVVSTTKVSITTDVNTEVSKYITVTTNDGSPLKPLTIELLNNDTTSIVVTIEVIDATTTSIIITYNPLLTEVGISTLVLTIDNNGTPLPVDILINYSSTIASSEFIVTPTIIEFGELGELKVAEQSVFITCENTAFNFDYLDTVIDSSDLSYFDISVVYVSKVNNTLKYTVTYFPQIINIINANLKFTYNNVTVGDLVIITGSCSKIAPLPENPGVPITAPLEPSNMLIPFKNKSANRFRIDGVTNNNDTYDEFQILNLDILLGTVMSSGEVVYVSVLYTPKQPNRSWPDIKISGIAFNDGLEVIPYVELPDPPVFVPVSHDPSPVSPGNTPVVPGGGSSSGGGSVPPYTITTELPYTQIDNDTRLFTVTTPSISSDTSLYYRVNVTPLSVPVIPGAPVVTFNKYTAAINSPIEVTFSNYSGDISVTTEITNGIVTPINLVGDTHVFNTLFYTKDIGTHNIAFTFHPSETVVNVTLEVTSVTPEYTIIPNITSVLAGGSVTFNITTTAADGGASSALIATFKSINTLRDHVTLPIYYGAANQLDVVTSCANGIGSFIVNIKNDFIISEGEKFYFDLLKPIVTAYLGTPYTTWDKVATSNIVTIEATTNVTAYPSVTFSEYNSILNSNIRITFSDFGDDTSVTSPAGSWGLLTPVTNQPQLIMSLDTDFFSQSAGTSVIPFTFHPSGTTINVNYTVTDTPVVVPTYSVSTVSPYTQSKGETRLFTVNTTDISSNAYINWEVIFTSSPRLGSYFTDNNLIGQSQIINNTATIIRTLAMDSSSWVPTDYNLKITRTGETGVKCISDNIIISSSNSLDAFYITTNEPYTDILGATRVFTVSGPSQYTGSYRFDIAVAQASNTTGNLSNGWYGVSGDYTTQGFSSILNGNSNWTGDITLLNGVGTITIVTKPNWVLPKYYSTIFFSPGNYSSPSKVINCGLVSSPTYDISVTSNIPVINYTQNHVKGLTYNYIVSVTGGTLPTWNASLGRYEVNCTWDLNCSGGLSTTNFSSATSGSLSVSVGYPVVIPLSLNSNSGSGSYTLQVRPVYGASIAAGQVLVID